MRLTRTLAFTGAVVAAAVIGTAGPAAAAGAQVFTVVNCDEFGSYKSLFRQAHRVEGDDDAIGECQRGEQRKGDLYVLLGWGGLLLI